MASSRLVKFADFFLWVSNSLVKFGQKNSAIMVVHYKAGNICRTFLWVSNFVREISIPSLPSGGLVASTGGLCKAGDILRTFLWVSILFVDFGNSLRM